MNGATVTMSGSVQGSSTDTVISTTFNWGDGSTVSTGSTPISHTYANAGTYDIIVTVYDSTGNNAFAEYSVTASAGGTGGSGTGGTGSGGSGTGTGVLVSPSGLSINVNGMTCNISGTFSSTVAIPKFNVAWGDGNVLTYTSLPVSHSYNAAGTYSITVTVFDSYGCSAFWIYSTTISSSASIGGGGTIVTVNGCTFYYYTGNLVQLSSEGMSIQSGVPFGFAYNGYSGTAYYWFVGLNAITSVPITSQTMFNTYNNAISSYGALQG
jgi:PKD repeat protein